MERLFEFVPENEPGIGNVFRAKKVISVENLKTQFPGGVADELNFCLFSTSGVHGTYSTIEDVEKYIGSVPQDKREGDDDRCDKVTFLVIRPRSLVFVYGNVLVVTQSDVDYLKKLRSTSTQIASNIGYRKGVIECWSCGLEMTLTQRSAEDGFCPKCHAEIELDDYPIGDEDESPKNGA